MASPPLTLRTRRLLLQVVLVGLFAGTLAVAAWVRHAKLGPSAGQLRQAFRLFDVRVRLPGGWNVEPGPRPPALPPALSTGRVPYTDPLTRSLVAEEVRDPYGASPGRYLEVTVTQLAYDGLTPEQHLRDAFNVSAAGAVPATVAGHPGIRVQASEPQISNSTGLPSAHVYACAILPQRYAVTIHLQVIGRRTTQWDLQLLSQVAEAVQVTDGPEAGPGDGGSSRTPSVRREKSR